MTFVISPTSIAQVFADNVQRIVKEQFDSNQTAAAKAWGMHQRTLGRVINGEQAANLRTVEEIATALHMEPWQLLIKEVEYKNPPQLLGQSKEMVEFMSRLKKAAEMLPTLPK